MDCDCYEEWRVGWNYCPICGNNSNRDYSDELLEMLRTLPLSSIESLLDVLTALQNDIKMQNDLIDDGAKKISSVEGNNYHNSDQLNDTITVDEDGVEWRVDNEDNWLFRNTGEDNWNLFDDENNEELQDEPNLQVDVDSSILPPPPPPSEHSTINCKNCQTQFMVHKNSEFARCPNCSAVKLRKIKRKKKRKKVTAKNLQLIRKENRPILAVVFSLIIVFSYVQFGENGISNSLISSVDDSDGDGLTDTQEWDLGTDSKLADTDGDGLSDSEEVSLGTNPLNRDTDNDGWNDRIDNWPLRNWFLEVEWSGWETEENSICDQLGSRALTWTIKDSSQNILDTGSSSGTFYVDAPDNLRSMSLVLNIDAKYWNCASNPQVELFYGFSCIDCSDPGPAGTGSAQYDFTLNADGPSQTKSITGARSGDDWRSEGWLSSSRVTVSSVFSEN